MAIKAIMIDLNKYVFPNELDLQSPRSSQKAASEVGLSGIYKFTVDKLALWACYANVHNLVISWLII